MDNTSVEQCTNGGFVGSIFLTFGLHEILFNSEYKLEVVTEKLKIFVWGLLTFWNKFYYYFYF
jgi:hypothetical protein